MDFLAVEPGWVLGDEPHEVLSDAWHALDLARELWSLVDDARAAALRAFQIREGSGLPSELRLGPRQIDELVGLLDGLEGALSARLLDPQHRLPADRLDEIARKAPSLSLSPTRRVQERVRAAEEALSFIDVLRAFLRRARARGDDIVSS